jgi:hypothetical protein
MRSDLQSIERRTYLAYFDDGLIELVAGLVVVVFGLGMVFDEKLFFVFTWMPVLLFWPLKRLLTFPRMGFVTFVPERRQRISHGLIRMLVAGLVALLVVSGALLLIRVDGFAARSLPATYEWLFLGTIMAVPLVLAAFFFEVARFIGYAALIFGAWLSAFLLAIEPGVPLVIAGASVLLFGLVFLTGFLLKYRLPDREVD